MNYAPKSSFARFRKLALIVATSALSITALNAATDVVKVDNDSRFRAAFVLEPESASKQFQLELSSDLVAWTPYDLDFQSDPAAWNVQEGSNISVYSQSQNTSGNWAVEFEFPIQTDTYARIVYLEGPFSADPTISAETRNLLKNIHRIGWDPDKFAFGQEFPLSYREGVGSGDGLIDRSDSKDVVGDHPGVHGSDFDYMLDRPWEEDFHIAAARRAYQDGAIVTFDWHWGGKYGGTYSAQVDDNKILDHVVRNDDSRGDVTWFYENIDRVLDRINNDLQIPIVFRPFHEMDGNWFWWGRQIDGGAETYQRAYQLLVEYMSARTDLVLFCWSPDVARTNFEVFYPGDDYVDIVGRDIYSVGNSGRPLSKLTEMIAFAAEHGKVAAFTETGYTAGGTSFETGDPDWWTTRILEPIKADPEAGKIAWVLTWINANWSGPYIPHAASPQAAKDDFQAFHDAPETLFQEDIAALNVYSPPPEE